ncbi:hypothetical protein V6N13_039273 [Hibiscus sabdariffa]
MALQATATASYLLTRRMIPLKVRRNACFASNNSSAAASQQGPRAVTGRYQDQAVRPLQNFSPDRWGDRFITLPFTNSGTLLLPYLKRQLLQTFHVLLVPQQQSDYLQYQFSGLLKMEQW